MDTISRGHFILETPHPLQLLHRICRVIFFGFKKLPETVLNDFRFATKILITLLIA